jgi:hypothetical protein
VLLNVKNNLENIKLTRVENMVVERQKNAWVHVEKHKNCCVRVYHFCFKCKSSDNNR